MKRKEKYLKHSGILRRTYNYDSAMLADSMKWLNANYHTKPVSSKEEISINKKITQFTVCKENKFVILKNAYKFLDEPNDSILALLSINSEIIITKKYEQRTEDLTTWEFVGICKLNRNFGHVYIRPETFHDKVMELIESIEIDFDYDKTFSKNYFALAENEKLFRDAVNKNFLKAFHLCKDYTVEILGQTMMVRAGRLVSKQSVYRITEFMKTVQKAL